MLNCFPQWLHHFTFPLAIHEDSSFSKALPKLDIFLLLLFVFQIIAILMGIEWYLTVVLIRISLMLSNLFMCLLAGCISLLEKCLFKTFSHSWIVCFFLFFFCSIVGIIYIFWINIFYQMICKYFLFLSNLPFYLIMAFNTQLSLILMKSNCSIFSLLPMLLVSYPRNYCQIQCHKDLFLCFHFTVL